MAKLGIAPTKSNLLSLRRQLAFAEEGYDLLEQKRQILIFELMSRLKRAHELEIAVTSALTEAFASLREAELDIGSAALERTAVAITDHTRISWIERRLMGVNLPEVRLHATSLDAQFGVQGTSANTDDARRRFTALLPLLAELAQVQNAIFRLAHELRRTQRRCNALSKVFIPNYRETIAYIVGTLEERERESFVIMKMVRKRL